MQPRPGRDPEPDEPQDGSQPTGSDFVTLAEYKSRSEAMVVHGLLETMGIPAALVAPEDLRQPNRILVPRQAMDEARAMLGEAAPPEEGAFATGLETDEEKRIGGGGSSARPAMSNPVESLASRPAPLEPESAFGGIWGLIAIALLGGAMFWAIDGGMAFLKGLFR